MKFANPIKWIDWLVVVDVVVVHLAVYDGVTEHTAMERIYQ
jgi:hypothetical protein